MDQPQIRPRSCDLTEEQKTAADEQAAWRARVERLLSGKVVVTFDDDTDEEVSVEELARAIHTQAPKQPEPDIMHMPLL